VQQATAPYVQSALDGVWQTITDVVSLPQRFFEASERRRLTGEYDPAPAVELMGLMAGVGVMSAERAALGVAGGRVKAAALAALPMGRGEPDGARRRTGVHAQGLPRWLRTDPQGCRDGQEC
jgi:hypothetical protein